MFKKLTLVCSVLALTLFFSGCGSKEAPKTTPEQKTEQKNNDSKQSTAEPKLNLESQETAEGVTFHFLKAFFGGEDQQAFFFLTQKAQETTKETFAASANDTIRWTVTNCETQNDVASVSVDLSDLDEAGDTVTEKLVFFLKSDNKSWRITGFKTKDTVISYENKIVTKEPVEVGQRVQESQYK